MLKTNPEFVNLYKVGVNSGLTAIVLNPSAKINIKFLSLKYPVYSFLFDGSTELIY